MEVHEKKTETSIALLDVWSESLGLELHALTLLSDRKGEFGELCAYEKGDAKTTVYHPEANAMAERRHKEISMFCGLLGSYGVFQVKALPEARGIF